MMNLEEAKRIYRDSSDLDRYGLSCFKITPKLARNEKLSDEQKCLVDTLSKGIQDEKNFGKSEVFFRGMSGIYLPEKGKLSIYKPLFSASRNLKEALGFLNEENPTLLKVVKPAEIKYLEMSSIKKESLEKEEVLFPMGLRFKLFNWNLSDVNEHERISIQLKAHIFQSYVMNIER